MILYEYKIKFFIYFVQTEERIMEEYINKSKISGDIFRFLYANKQSSRQEISQSLGISLPTTTRSLNVLSQPEEEKQSVINVYPIPGMLSVLISQGIIFL